MAASPAEQRLGEWIGQQQRVEQIAAQAGVSVDDLLDSIEGCVADARSALTEPELSVLDRAGIDLFGHPADPSGAGAVVGGRVAEQALTSDGLTVEEAASVLGVTAARVRQRIADGDIATIRRTEGHVLPRWQFIGDTVVPGLRVVVPAAATLHPLAFARFMSRPCSELVIDDEPVSPVAWLAGGGSATTVADLVEALTYA